MNDALCLSVSEYVSMSVLFVCLSVLDNSAVAEPLLTDFFFVKFIFATVQENLSVFAVVFRWCCISIGTSVKFSQKWENMRKNFFVFLSKV